ncbi:MAG: hypothetical protein U5R06_04550 [candidate division KSB1 bacterium]|nr:hypothetical protein [candidate division KSB1 bacterium]
MIMSKSSHQPVSEVNREIETSFHQNLQWWNYVRWLSTIIFLSIGILQMAVNRVEFPRYSFILILMSIIFLNFCYSFWIDNFSKRKIYPVFHNLLDIIIFSLGIYMTGGLESPLIWLYIIPILTSSITIDRKTGFFATVFSVIGLVFMLFFSEIGFGMDLVFSSEFAVFLTDHLQILLSYTVLFFLAYFVSSYLAKSLWDQNQAFQDLSLTLEEKNKEFESSLEEQLSNERQSVISRLSRTFRHAMNNPLAILTFHFEMLIKDKGKNLDKRGKVIRDTLMRMKVIMNEIENFYKEKPDNDIDMYDLGESTNPDANNAKAETWQE